MRRRTVPAACRTACLAAAVLPALLPAAPAAAQPVAVASQQGARVTRLDGAAAGTDVAVAPSPAVIAADGVGRLYVSHPDGHAVTVIEADGSTRRLPFAGQAFGLAVEPDGSAIYVGDWSGNRVVRLSGSGAVTAEVAVGRDPAGLVLGPPGRLYVAERESRSVGIIDTARMERVAGVPVGEGPFALGYDPVRGRLYAANVRSNDLTAIDTASGRALTTVPAGNSPYGVAVTPDGGRILVTNQHGGTLSVLDADTLRITATVPVGQYPEGVAIRGDRAFVANWFSDDVSVIDLGTLREVGRIRVAEGPRTLLVTPEAVPGQRAPR